MGITCTGSYYTRWTQEGVHICCRDNRKGRGIFGKQEVTLCQWSGRTVVIDWLSSIWTGVSRNYLLAAAAVCVYELAGTPPSAPPSSSCGLLSAAPSGGAAAPLHGGARIPHGTLWMTVDTEDKVVRVCRPEQGSKTESWHEEAPQSLTGWTATCSSTSFFSSALLLSVKPLWRIHKWLLAVDLATRRLCRKLHTWKRKRWCHFRKKQNKKR